MRPENDFGERPVSNAKSGSPTAAAYPRNDISTPAATAEPMTPEMLEAMQ